MKVPFTLGTVGHFGLAVTSPKRSAKWFERALGLSVEFEYEDTRLFNATSAPTGRRCWRCGARTIRFSCQPVPKRSSAIFRLQPSASSTQCPPQKIECHDFGQSLKRFVA